MKNPHQKRRLKLLPLKTKTLTKSLQIKTLKQSVFVIIFIDRTFNNEIKSSQKYVVRIPNHF